ncbi:MAG: SpoIIE family protein phosphatase [Bacteroidetes bacterium]|nr:SpoIIE family protein phosphatase [Bacteroidota bacterium]
MLKADNNNAVRNLSALVDFSNLINSSLNVEFALNNILLTCFGKFHTTKGIIALVDDGILKVKVSKGLKENIVGNFPCIPFGKNNTDLKIFLDENNFPICREISSQNKILGVLILGERFTKKPYDDDDLEFLNTLLNIGSTAIENSLIVAELKDVNRNLDSKVNQLSSLFDLSKEFSGILEEEMVGKLLVYSIIGQLLVTKFAVVTCSDKNIQILETKIPEQQLRDAITSCEVNKFNKAIVKDEIENKFEPLAKIGIVLVIPMQIKGETKGLILLGSRLNKMPFSQSDIEFASSVGGLAIISIENSRLFKEALEKQRLEKDLEIARNIQKNLLPDIIPKLDHYEIAAFNQSARQVGGDYYDIVKLDNGNTVIAIADVSGKGVQAALLMANVQAFLKSICKQNIDLDKASNLINDLVSENTTEGSFITFFWGVLNNETKELTYVNAGHNPPMLIRDNEIIKLKTGGMILGVMQTIIPYQSEVVKLHTGDVIFLFTDGITEAMNINNEEYTDERLEELALNISAKTPNEILETIKNDVSEFTTGAVQSDDITCLILKVR